MNELTLKPRPASRFLMFMSVLTIVAKSVMAGMLIWFLNEFAGNMLPIGGIQGVGVWLTLILLLGGWIASLIYDLWRFWCDFPFYFMSIEVIDDRLKFSSFRINTEVHRDEVTQLEWKSGILFHWIILHREQEKIPVRLDFYQEEDQWQFVIALREHFPEEIQTGWEDFSWKYAVLLLPEVREMKRKRKLTFRIKRDELKTFLRFVLMLIGLYLVMSSPQLKNDYYLIALFLPGLYLMYSVFKQSGVAALIHPLRGIAAYNLVFIPSILAALTLMASRVLINQLGVNLPLPAFVTFLFSLIVLFGAIALVQNNLARLIKLIGIEARRKWEKFEPKYFSGETMTWEK